jgi:hypothetical protein
MKRLVIDLDYTITADSRPTYAEAPPNHAVIRKHRDYGKEKQADG